MNNLLCDPVRAWPYVGALLVAASMVLAHEGSHEFSEPAERIAELEIKEAVHLYWRLFHTHPQAQEHFRDLLTGRDDLEEYVTGRIEALPHTHATGSKRSHYFSLLTSLRTPWAVRLCAQYLPSDEWIEPPFKTEKEAMEFFESGGIFTSNPSFALIALEWMQIDTAPRVLEQYISFKEKKLAGWSG